MLCSFNLWPCSVWLENHHSLLQTLGWFLVFFFLFTTAMLSLVPPHLVFPLGVLVPFHYSCQTLSSGHHLEALCFIKFQAGFKGFCCWRHLFLKTWKHSQNASSCIPLSYCNLGYVKHVFENIPAWCTVYIVCNPLAWYAKNLCVYTINRFFMTFVLCLN